MAEDSLKLVGIHKGCWPNKKLNFATMITEDVIDILQLWAKEIEASFGTYSKPFSKPLLSLSTENSIKSKQFLTNSLVN